MTTPAERFYSSIKGAEKLSDPAKVEHFVYFLTEVLGEPFATARAVEQCFRDCDLKVPASLAVYLSKGLSSTPRKFVKVGSGGYKPERHRKEFISKQLGVQVHTVDIPNELRALENRLPDGAGKKWFGEALDCFGVEAHRAALIMVWIFALDHLFEYILKHHLQAFNTALANHPDKRTVKKVGQVSSRDDFTQIGEEMFIELCRTAKIISPDVRKILDGALGVRNSAAHPSGVSIPRGKVAVVAEDLVLNVVLKYAL